MITTLGDFGSTDDVHRAGVENEIARFHDLVARLRASLRAGRCDQKLYGSMAFALGAAGMHALSVDDVTLRNVLRARVDAAGNTALAVEAEYRDVCLGSRSRMSLAVPLAVAGTAAITGLAVAFWTGK